jgi:hypothetical protein
MPRCFSVRGIFFATVLVMLSVTVFVAQPASYAFTNGQGASLVLGQPDFKTSTHSAAQTGLNSPFGVSFDSYGDLWVADYANNRVLEYACTASGSCVNGNNATLVLGQDSFTDSTYATTQSGLFEPAGVGFDSHKDLWVADLSNNRILEYACTASGSCVNGNNATLVLGQDSFTASTEATTQSGLFEPAGVGFDSQGDLWVADWANNRVLEYACTASGSCVNGNNATLVLGQDSFTASTEATTQSGLFEPAGVGFDSQGDLWVADWANNRVLEYACTASGSCVNGNNATLVLGQGSFTTSIDSTTQAGLSFPHGVGFDSQGDLWVADGANNRVLEYACTASGSCVNGNNATLVIGQDSFTDSTYARTQAGLSFPHGVGFDSQGDLWVADEDNNRVLEYAQAQLTVTATSTVSSTSYVTQYSTTKVTSYSTSTSTSTIPTLTTIVLVPLTTMTSTVQSTQYLTSILTTTVTSYASTLTSTTTVVVPTTVTVGPSTSTVQTTQVLTSTGDTTVTGYTTTTVTNYTGTTTLTSTIPTVTTVVLVPVTVASTAESTQYLTSTTTMTVTNYTATTTSTSTSVVYTTVTATSGGSSAAASSPLAYLGFTSLFGITVGQGVTAGKRRTVLKLRSLMKKRCMKT